MRGVSTKKFVFLKQAALFLSALSCFFFSTNVAYAIEKIETFSSHITINANGSITVQEEISYNFSTDQHHGIIREIPLVYKPVGSDYESKMEISSISVTDGHGNLRPTSYDKGGNSVSLKIGDPDTLVTGIQFYVVRYTIWGAITSGLTNDTLYWNATGNSWGVPIDRARVDVVLPTPLRLSRISFNCYVGFHTDPCEATSTQMTATGTVSMVRFDHHILIKGEAFRAMVAIPKGIILFTQAPGQQKKTYASGSGIIKWWQKPFIDLSLSFPFFVFAGMYSLWWGYNENKKKKGWVNKKNISSKEPFASLRATYFLAGIVLIFLSFYVPAWNIGVLGSGLVICCFGFLYSNRK